MRIAIFGLLLGSLCLASCDDSTDAVVVHLPQPATLALRTVGGRGLPIIVFDSLSPAFRLEVTSGTFTINSDRTFTSITRLRETRTLVIAFRTVVCTGTFSNTGSTFTFVTVGSSFECDAIFTGVSSVGVLNTTLRGQSATYTR